MNRDRIEAAIRAFASSPKSVRFDELITFLDTHIQPMFPNYNHHGSAHHGFTVGQQTFNIVKPHKGPFVKKCYVEKFLDAMEAVGLYDGETEK
jgi:hypothetical protein